MARRTIHFSDLTSQPILDDADVVRVVVVDHPVLNGGAVEFEAAVDELTDIDDVALDAAVIELHTAAEQPPRRVVLDAATFGKLAVDKPMDELLKSATPIRPNGRTERAPASRAADRVNYATLEHAGAPHKGKVTEVEARLVRANLDIVNARLAASGQRTIDPADPTTRERYGFGATEDEADSTDGPTDSATSSADQTTSSEHAAAPTATASVQGPSAARPAAGHRRSSADSSRSTPGAASTQQAAST
jgi:hypothetical protein